jgi:hypothetical protein
MCMNKRLSKVVARDGSSNILEQTDRLKMCNSFKIADDSNKSKFDSGG